MRISDWSSDVCSSDLRLPFRAAWRGDFQLVQPCADPAQRFARLVAGEYRADDLRFLLVGLTQAGDQLAALVHPSHDVVAEGAAAWDRAIQHGGNHAAPGLVREVFQVQRIHRPLEADVQLGYLALGYRFQSDA